MNDKVKSILSNKIVQLVLALILGIAIGAIFYPSKNITEEEKQKYEREIQRITTENSKTIQSLKEEKIAIEASSKSKIEELNKTISIVKKENTQLKQKSEETIVRVIHPNGTIEEKIFKKSESEQISEITTQIMEEFNKKIKENENNWKQVHEKRVTELKQEFNKKIQEKDKVIAELEKSKTTTINQRKFGVSAGIMSDKNYFGTIKYTIFGPIFIQGIAESGPSLLKNSNIEKKAGVGIGFEF